MAKEKIYRPNVAAVILSSAYPEKKEIFLGNRIDYKADIWQFPQGGIDEGESPEEALLRELKEEIGTNEVEILGSCPQWHTYDFPNISASKMYPFDGQKQKFFIVKLKPEAVINLKTEIPEFISYKFVAPDDLLKSIGKMKRKIYKKVMKYFIENGFI